MSVAAIPTRYAGCHFRSRLEARWAVFFDALNIEWLYEPEGFEYQGYPDHQPWRYLPDFHLPQLNVWVEVKGDMSLVDDDYLLMLGNSGHFLPGLHNAGHDGHGVLLLGQVPQPRRGSVVGHTMLSHYKGLMHGIAHFDGPRLYNTPTDLHFPDPGTGMRSMSEFQEEDLIYAYQRYDLWNARRIETDYHTNIGTIVDRAYIAARSARFEHGHSGAS